MADSSEKRDHTEKRGLDIENPDSSQQPIGTKEEVTSRVGKHEDISQVSVAPESEGHESEDEEGGSNSANGTPIRPLSSRASSVFSRTGAVVPRAQRRGLLGRFTVIPELERPQEYTGKTKWAITACIALEAAAAPIGAGIFYRTSGFIIKMSDIVDILYSCFD